MGLYSHLACCYLCYQYPSNHHHYTNRGCYCQPRVHFPIRRCSHLKSTPSSPETPGKLTFTLMHPHQPHVPPTIIHILPIFTPLHPSFHSITSSFILISPPSLSSHPHSTHLTPHHPSFFSSCLHLSLSFLPFPIIAKLENPQKPEKNQKKNQKQKQNKK